MQQQIKKDKMSGKWKTFDMTFANCMKVLGHTKNLSYNEVATRKCVIKYISESI